MAVLSTIITGTILATGKTFTHGLGTTPDIVIVTPETNAGDSTADVAGFFVSTFNSQIMVVGGVVDASEFRALVIKLHSIIQ